MAEFVVVSPRFDQTDIRLRFVEVIQADRQLRSHERLSLKYGGKKVVGAAHGRSMPGTHRAHLDDLSVNELRALSFPEDARLGHPVILVHGEESLGCLGLHTTSAV